MNPFSQKTRVQVLVRSALPLAAMATPPLIEAAEPRLDWGLQVGTVENDYSLGVAANASGVYLTGYTFGPLAAPSTAGTTDAYLLRYDHDGKLIWGRHIGSTFSERGLDVFASPAGGAYVTGLTGGHLEGQNRGGHDLFLARFDEAGTRLWTRQVGTPINDSGVSVFADSLGSVFVGGNTFGNLAATNTGINKTDAILSRYDQNGDLIWTRQWGKEDNDSANGVVGDGTGGVFVTGSTRTLQGPTQTGADTFLRRYDRNGNFLWEKILASSGSAAQASDIGRGITADGHGGVYISGETQGSLAGANPTPGTNDPFLARYDADGNLLWIRQINTPGQDFAGKVVFDPNAGVFITGELIQALPGETSKGLSDAFIAQFNEQGELLWSEQFGSDKVDTGFGISADGVGGVYVSGSTWGSLFGSNRGGPYDAFLARFEIPVPEPSGLMPLSAAAAALARVRRRRRHEQ